MKKAKIPQTVKEIDARILDLKEEIETENKAIAVIKSDLAQKQTESEQDIKEHEIIIQECNLLLKHYQEERILVSNPSSRNGRQKD